MAASKPNDGTPLRGVCVSVTASTQAALLLTPLLVELSGRGIGIGEAGPGMWSLEAWTPERLWRPRALTRLQDACRRLSRHFCQPSPPVFRWEYQERGPKPPKGEKRFFRPFLATERLWVVRPGDRVEATPGQTVLELDLGKARGSGIHPQTRCALRLLETVVARGAPEGGLDVETGTGILALCAGLGGVRRVLALDRDPHAVTVARRNVRRNGLQGCVKVRCLNVTRDGGRYPLVMARLSGRALHRQVSGLLRRVADGGWLILGGIWHRRAGETAARFAPTLSLVHQETEAWWTALLLRGG